MLLYGEIGKTMKTKETIVVYDLKLAIHDQSDKFLLTSKLIYMYKIMKKLYKIRLQRDNFETCNK